MTKDLAKPVDQPESVEIGQWYWMKHKEGPWLGCVVWIGSNFVKLESPDSCSWRIHFDEWPHRVISREHDAEGVIERHVQEHRQNVATLLDQIKQVTAQLGITQRTQLGAGGEQSNALMVVHGTENVKQHKQALIRAKEKTLPELFEKVEEEHEQMAMWMKARLIPMKAESDILEKRTAVIEDRIFVVELYAGLVEELRLIHKGEPAGNDEKIHLFQRRHYMDEECLVDYEAGGMEFDDLSKFDAWLMRKPNRERILPMPKCVVAFQVRRRIKEREVASISDFISLSNIEKADRLTFLYIRNGDSYYRLSTEIDFGPQLFPDPEDSLLMNKKIYTDKTWGRDIISQQQYEQHKAHQAEELTKYQQELAAWKKLPKAEREKRGKPWYSDYDRDRWIEVTPQTVYYDDAMRQVAEQTKAHNRVAVVLQGLLDRSPAFHPHPPWRLWTAEGFQAGVVLCYDDSRGLTAGAAPDFEAYRQRLNTSVTLGTHMVGQYEMWLRAEAEKENERQRRDWRIRNSFEYHHFHPYGNPGPDKVAPVAHLSLDKNTCTFKWQRERLGTRWVDNPDKPGWMMRDKSGLGCRFKCPIDYLLNVDAYSPGDYKQFYADPRTRQDYLKWAPLLLLAEDFKVGKHHREKK